MAKVITIGESDSLVMVVKRGRTFRLNFRCKDASQTVVDLSDYEAEFKAVFRATTITKVTADLLDKTTDGDADIGMIHLVLVVEDTREVPLGKQMIFSIELTAPDGDQTPVVTGLIDGRQGADNDD